MRFSWGSVVLAFAGLAFAAAVLVCNPLMAASHFMPPGGGMCAVGFLDGNYLIPAKERGLLGVAVFGVLIVSVATAVSLRTTLFLLLRQLIHRRFIPLRNLDVRLHDFFLIAFRRGILHSKIY